MKVWSPLLASLLLLKLSSAQYHDDISIETVDDDDVPVVGKTYSPPVSDTTEPCNGYPEYRKLPINQYFFFGANDISTQSRTIPDMLKDGLRYLDFKLCNSNNDIVLCSDNDNTSFSNALNQVLDFARDSVEQLIVINVKTNGIKIQDIEQAIDPICKVHAEKTPGTNEYENGECPFIYKYTYGAFPSIGSVVNYDPDMAQWVGDGELVGVRTKLILTLSNEDAVSTPGYKSAYFSPVFWRPSSIKTKDTNDIMSSVSDLCRVPGGGIGIEAHINNKDENAKIDEEFIEELLSSKEGCNINDTPLNSFINVLSLDNYETRDLVYLKELEKRLLHVNYAKWSGKYPQLTPSTTITKMEQQQKVQRDEL